MARQSSDKMDQDVTAVLDAMGAYLAARRKELNLRQTDIAERLGITQATIIRAEKSCGQVRAATLFEYANELGLLDEFTSFLSGKQAPERQRVRHSQPVELDPAKPLSTAKFTAFIAKQPHLEAPVSQRTAFALAKLGYAIRSEETDNGNVFYATTVESAAESEYVYQTHTKGDVGGLDKLRLVIAKSMLNKSQLRALQEDPEFFVKTSNLKFKNSQARVIVKELNVIETGSHVLTFLKDGREVSSQFLYDIVLNTLSELGQ